MLAASVKKRHWGRWVVFGSLFLVVAVVAVSCYFYEEEVVPADKMVFQKQYSASLEVDRAVGEAIEKYVSVLDAEYTDHDCWMIAHDRVNQFPGCRRIEHYSQRKSVLTSKVIGAGEPWIADR